MNDIDNMRSIPVFIIFIGHIAPIADGQMPSSHQHVCWFNSDF